MRDVTHWSVSCGRGAEVDVRLHASIFLVSAAWLHWGTREGTASAGAAVVGLVVYLLSLAAHELAHAFAAWRWDCRVERVVLGPFGGLTPLGRSLDPHAELVIALAGPAANLTLLVAAVVPLAALQQPVAPVMFLFAPPAATLQLSLVGVLSWIAWINLLLGLANLLPAYPFDGARAVTALLRQRFDEQEAAVQGARVGVVTSLVCLVASWFIGHGFDSAALLLTLVGIVAFFCSRLELLSALTGDYEADDDEPSPYATEEPRPPRGDRLGPLRRWWQQRQEIRRQQQLQIEREEEERADEILARLHSLGGLQALSPDDRAMLERVSARYRHRQQG
jgi:Zn-dependent protease